MFLGYAPEILKILDQGENVKDGDDDQLFYTNIYLDQEKRESLKITLDSISRIFQNLNGVQVEREFDNEDGHAMVFNADYNTHPAVIHGNGPSKIRLNQLGNYIAHRYNRDFGCRLCQEPLVELDPLPRMSAAVFITKPTPYVEEFLSFFERLDYPKNLIDLHMYNNQRYSYQLIEQFAEKAAISYASVTVVNSDKASDEYTGRDEALKWAATKANEFYFSLDADVHLNATNALQMLVQRATTYKTDILTPMLLQPGKLFSNFWGDVSDIGYYSRSDDYQDIAEYKLKGVWNVPFVASVMLVAKDKVGKLTGAFSHNLRLDADMSFAQFCREKGHFMFVDNQQEYGYLVVSDDFQKLPEGTVNRELYDFPNNKHLWEQRYLHKEYRHYAEPGVDVPLACNDVYDFPFLSPRACREIIEVMENFGQWSDGTNFDRRLDGGYENVPTRDIHMNQVGFDAQWLAIMDEYVAPIQEKTFIGYYQRPVKANMMFVVRYRPSEQASLRPHHDASTYSIDIALNKKGVDYQGGGVRYIRQNCTVPADQVGWSMLFPGRLSHLHEGLTTTKGTRYILVSFINP
ncbi:Procollagen-lysine,2-oxoglutarate 5-dioxygenase precursor [Aphelenchoides avenae]|nr:Procollagen-lysine,2-oxoglutarate 5-dioxygenase precursor [Aphelenchus avenae]